jgi:hypothetical protein
MSRKALFAAVATGCDCAKSLFVVMAGDVCSVTR